MPKVTAQRPHSVLSLFLLTVLICSLGLVAVYNSSVVEAFNQFHDKYHFVKQQAILTIFGLISFIVISRIPIGLIRKLAPYAFAVSLFLMLIVLIPGIGMRLQGARRWINLGFTVLQPSEPFKVALVLYLAYWLEKPRQIKQFISVLGLSLILVMLQPDLGTTIVIGTTAFLVYYLSGAPVKELFIIATSALIFGIIMIVTSSYRLQRVQTFLDPTNDPLGSSYHINQVLLGLGSGGWLGVGLGRSIQKHAYLPEATTDSIFAVVGEELGFVGGVTLMALMLVLVLYAFKLSLRAKSTFGKLAAAGIAGLVAVQTFLNISAMVALVPLTGVPLPLISYGGSSLFAVLSALGILASAAQEK